MPLSKVPIWEEFIHANSKRTPGCIAVFGVADRVLHHCPMLVFWEFYEFLVLVKQVFSSAFCYNYQY